MTFYTKVSKIICEHLDRGADEVTLSAKLKEDLGADSLDAVELVMEFEEEFGIDIPDEEAEKLLTVGDMVDFIESRIK